MMITLRNKPNLPKLSRQHPTSCSISGGKPNFFLLLRGGGRKNQDEPGQQIKRRREEKKEGLKVGWKERRERKGERRENRMR